MPGRPSPPGAWRQTAARGVCGFGWRQVMEKFGKTFKWALIALLVFGAALAAVLYGFANMGG